MLKVKFRNTRENKPTVEIDDLSKFLGDSYLDEGEQLTLRLVNSGGITTDVVFSVLEDGETIQADGWPEYLLPLARNNKPFEIGVCAAEEGDEITTQFGKGTPVVEQDFEEFDDEEEEDDFDDSDDEDEEEEDDFDDSYSPTVIPASKHAPKSVAKPAAKKPAKKAAPAPAKKASKKPYADALKKYGTQAAAARALGIGVDAFRYRLKKE